MTTTHRGFTLMELLVVLAIGAILLAVGMPSLKQMLINGSRREASIGLFSALNMARSEAIARNTTVSVCARDLSASTPTCTTSSDSSSWMNGWLVYTDSATGTRTTIRVQQPVSVSLRFQTAPGSVVSFDASGRTTGAVDFRLCPTAGTQDQRSRLVQVRRSGGISLKEAATCT